MPEDPHRREPGRPVTSTRAAAMWLALLAVALGGVLLLALWSTGLAANLSAPKRWWSLAAAAVGFFFLTWAVITAFGVFTQASASFADPGFLSVQPPRRLFIRSSQSRKNLRDLLLRTARVLGAHVVHLPESGPDQPHPPPEELDLERRAGHALLPAAGSLRPDAGGDSTQGAGNESQRIFLELPLTAATGLLAPRNDWIARVWLRATGEHLAIGALATIVAVLILASGHAAQPSTGTPPSPSPATGTPQSSSPATGTPQPSSPATGTPQPSSPATGTPQPSSPTTGTPHSSSPTTGPAPPSPLPLRQAMLSNVVAGIAPVLAEALAQPLAGLATSATSTPDELKKLALDNVVAPFLQAGSTKLGDALAGALARSAGLTPSPAPPTPQEKAIAQVQAALQLKLTVQFASMPELTAVAAKAGRTADQLAAELAHTIAEGLASDLAHGLARIPSSAHLDYPLVTIITEGVTQQQLSQQPPSSSPPQPGRLYAVQPGDSLWRISQRLLGPGAAAPEIDQAWRMIYRDNRATIGTDPNRIVPGQLLRIPRTLLDAPSRAWIPWLFAPPGALTGIAARRRWRSRTARRHWRPTGPI
jgi:LysM domain